MINNMRARILFTMLASLALLFVLLPAAQAGPVSITFLGPTTGSFGGVGLDPYQFSVGGVDMWLNCDDWPDHIASGDTWTADVIAGSGALAGTRMSIYNGWSEAQADAAYSAKAWLELNSSAAANPAYSYALWAIMCPGCGVPSPTGAAALVTLAEAAAAADPTLRDSLTIYSPIAARPDGSFPQELNSVPDGGVTLMLLGGALVGLETLRRRFRV